MIVEVDGRWQRALGPDAPPRCWWSECGKSISSHASDERWAAKQGRPAPHHRYRGPEANPGDHQIASALAVTDWTCPFCKAENDVWGEGAVYHWMECPECDKSAYLVMDPDRG